MPVFASFWTESGSGRPYRPLHPRRVLRAALFASCLVIPAEALDQSLAVSQFIHTRWSQREGFTLPSIQAIAQTSDGYLWLGTAGGLFRFDGLRATPWPLGQPIANAEIRAITAGRNGSLWMSTGSGIVNLDRDRVRSWTVGTGTSAGTAVTILEDRGGRLWVGSVSSGRGLSLIAPGSSTLTPTIAGAPPGSILSLFEDRDGNVWAGTNSALCRVRANDVSLCYSGRTVEPMAIAQSSDGSLIFADLLSRGILRFSSGTFESLTPLAGISDLIPRALITDRDGNIWLGTLGQGLFRIRGKHIERFTRKEGLSSDVVETLKEDQQGNLWVGTANGLDRFSDPEAPRLSTLEGLSSDLITSVYGSSNGSTWVGTAGGGLNRIRNGVIAAYGRTDGLPNNTILALGEDNRGRLWVGTATGVALSAGSRFLPVSMNGHSVNQVFAIAGAPDGTVWLASAKNGLIKVSNGKAKLVSIPNLPTDQEVSQILCARSGVLWVGFYNGAVAMLEGDRLTRFGPGNGLAAGIVQAFFEDVEGALWVGTSEGLSRFRHGQWTTWSRKLGIPQGGVHAIVDDSRGSLILLGARAVFRILPAPLKMSLDGSPQPLLITRIGSGESVVLQNRGTMAGPQVTKSADGRVWVGTNDGVVVFDTAKPRRSESGPPVFIERASLDGRALNTDPSQVAIFRGRELELEYTALDLSNPEGVRFLYRLKGLDPAWKDGGPQRQIRYANLRPGDYRFELRAANAGGTWNQEGAAWSFRVAPYFYQTLWFATLCGACAIALAWAVYKYRVERLSERFQVVLAERSRLARELHDTLLQGFSGVLFQLEAAMRQFDSEPETSRQRINRALIQADESMQEARQTITLMRSPRQDDFRFDEILTEAGEQLTSGTSIAFESVTSGQPELLPYDVQWNLYALSREAIHNAIKHAQPEKITLRMSYQPRLFRVVVEDNGIGFDGSVRGGPKNRFGLLSMRERATHIGAEFAIRSEPGSGTRIEVAVRVRKSSFS